MGRAATVPAVSHLGDPAGLRSRRAGASPRRLSEPIGASLRVRPERLAGESFAALAQSCLLPTRHKLKRPRAGARISRHGKDRRAPTRGCIAGARLRPKMSRGAERPAAAEWAAAFRRALGWQSRHASSFDARPARDRYRSATASSVTYGRRLLLRPRQGSARQPTHALLQCRRQVSQQPKRASRASFRRPGP